MRWLSLVLCCLVCAVNAQAADYPVDIGRPNLSAKPDQVQLAGKCKCGCNKKKCRCKNCPCKKHVATKERQMNERKELACVTIANRGCVCCHDGADQSAGQFASGLFIAVPERLVSRTALRGSAVVLLAESFQRIQDREPTMRFSRLLGEGNRSASRLDVQGTPRKGMRSVEPHFALSRRGKPSFMGWASRQLQGIESPRQNRLHEGRISAAGLA